MIFFLRQFAYLLQFRVKAEVMVTSGDSAPDADLRVWRVNNSVNKRRRHSNIDCTQTARLATKRQRSIGQTRQRF